MKTYIYHISEHCYIILTLNMHLLFQKIVPGIVKKSPKCSFSACETANYYTFAVVMVQLNLFCMNYFCHCT